MKLKYAVSLVMLILAFTFTSFTTGCQGGGGRKLAEGGAYKGDQVLYSADKTLSESYKVLDGFVKWEYQNRAVLQSTDSGREITKVADQVRRNAAKWTDTALAARETYIATRSEEDRTKLQSAIAVLQTALDEATKYMLANEQKR